MPDTPDFHFGPFVSYGVTWGIAWEIGPRNKEFYAWAMREGIELQGTWREYPGEAMLDLHGLIYTLRGLERQPTPATTTEGK